MSMPMPEQLATLAYHHYREGLVAIRKALRATETAARTEERERIKALIVVQPYYPDTHTGMRQQWVKDEILRKIDDGLTKPAAEPM